MGKMVQRVTKIGKLQSSNSLPKIFKKYLKSNYVISKLIHH